MSNRKHVYVIVSEGRVASVISDSEDIEVEVIDLDDADASSDDVRESEYKRVEQLAESCKSLY